MSSAFDILTFGASLIEFCLITAIWSRFGDAIRGTYAETFNKYFASSNNASLLPTCETLMSIWFTLWFLLMAKNCYKLYLTWSPVVFASRKSTKRMKPADRKPSPFNVCLYLLTVYVRVSFGFSIHYHCSSLWPFLCVGSV
jgi:hypothetical protein